MTIFRKVYVLSALAALIAGPATRAQAPATPPPSTSGIFPLASVHRGLHGTAWTVFEGDAPEPMGVDVLGVLRNAGGPGEDIILARLTGAKAEYTGVVAGMSGSPVYIDDKLVGAIAFRIGQFSKEPIAGITPIERMLEVRDMPERTGQLQLASASPAPLPVMADAKNPSELMRPIETPLVFSGFSPEALNLWREHAPALGLEPVAGIGGASGLAGAAGVSGAAGGDAGVRSEGPLLPGSAVSALLVRGDLEIAATCTVTYLDPRRLLACGHPITQYGAVSMPMTRATVVATLPSPMNAFKIVNTAQTIGSFTEDRQSAIAGTLALPARMVPMTIRVRDTDDTAKGGAATRTLNLEIVNQPQLTPTAVLVSVFQALTQTNRSDAESSFRITGTIRLMGHADVHLHSLIAPSDQAPASLATALLVGENFSRLYDSPARREPIEAVDIELERLPGRRAMQLTDARLEQSAIHPGEQLTLDATLEPYRGEARHVSIPFKLPASIGPGTLRLLVSDGATLDRLGQAAHTSPAELDETIAQLNSTHEDDRLYVTLLTSDLEASLDGRVLPTLPPSMANLLEPQRAAQKLSLRGESLLPVASVAAGPGVGSSVSGQQVLLLRVE